MLPVLTHVFAVGGPWVTQEQELGSVLGWFRSGGLCTDNGLKKKASKFWWVEDMREVETYCSISGAFLGLATPVLICSFATAVQGSHWRI